MGSQSDWEIMSNASTTLDSLGIQHEVSIISAHRTPDKLVEYCSSAQERGLKVLITAAGLAAVTNLLAQGRRTGIAVRLLLPEDPEATEVIEQADLGRFLAPGGIWNRSSSRHTGPMEPHTAVALVA